jgi:hypothetical protein
LRLDKGITFGGAQFNVYLLVLNAFNTELVNEVYGTTGLAGEDGWIETPEGQVWLEGATANNPNVDSVSLYNARLGRNGTATSTGTGVPTNRWGVPRSIRFGIQVNI